MCGILGTIPSTEAQPFANALALLKHRGPDGTGVWHSDDRAISLGHQRLSIIDLSDNASQPFVYEHYVVTFNGEIYNFIELKQELEGKGYVFQTQSDTEVLAIAYAHWGKHCLQRFNGMWAFAIWNRKENSLFLSRDRFGLKPLFYSQQKEQFIFASEMKAIVPFLREVKPSRHFQWMVQHDDSYQQMEDTLVEGIKRLPPGHYGEYIGGKLTINRYWNTLDNLVDVPDSYEEQVEVFRELLEKAVRLRLRTDVNLGCALSGGLDSSSVVATVARQQESSYYDQLQQAYVAVLPNTVLDEQRYAEHVLERYDIPSHLVEIDPNKGIDRLEDSLYLFEEIYRTSPVPMRQLYSSYRRNGTYVSLDGHGPDELFAGYGNFFFLSFVDSGFDPEHIRQMTATYREMFPEGDTPMSTKKTGWLSYFKTMGWYGLQKLKGPAHHWEQQDRKNHADQIKQMGVFNYELYKLFHYTIFPTLLRNYDRYSMMNGVEVRMPFTDHRLVSFCFSLPWQSKLKDGYTKSLLRDAVADWLPESITQRKRKIGFQTPITHWLHGPWKDYFMDAIRSQSFKECTLINPPKVQRAILGLMNNPNASIQEGEKVWLQIAPYLWEQSFLKRGTNH